MASNNKELLDPGPPSPRKAPDGPPPEEGLPPWMATFADMVTLLLCFFVLLLSFTNQDAANFRMMMGSIQNALGVQTKDRGALNTPYAQTSMKFEDRQSKNREMVEIGAHLKEYIRDRQLTNTARVSDEKSGVMFHVQSSALFPKGSAELAPDAGKSLNAVVDILKKHPEYNCVIRGHTDGEKSESELYSSNWELSAARAAACLRWVLANSDIKPNRLKAVGYASAKPLLPSTSEENRRKNRRVDFFILPNKYGTW